MLTAVADALDRLYPSGRWGQPDDEARFGAGVSDDDAQRLADELSSELDASALFCAGGPDEYCNYIYVLCLGREPCLVQLREGGVPLPDELRDSDFVGEQYLRVCLSDLAPFAGVQQTAMELVIDGDDLVIVETPRPGVYDAPLLSRFQRLVAILPAYGITHLDFGEISAPPPGFEAGDYRRMYGQAPHVSNFLFYPQPSNTRVTTVMKPAT